MTNTISRLNRLIPWRDGLRAGLAALAVAVMLGTGGIAAAQTPQTPPVVATPPADAAAPEDVPVVEPVVEQTPAVEEVVADVVEEPAAIPVPDKGDTTWMLVSTVLVLLMIVPGLALFYGGLVRSKNMLSLLMQVSTVTVIGMLAWAIYGYSLSFTDGGGLNKFIGGASKVFLNGVNYATLVETFSVGVYLPELVFVAFQMTFACITAALVLGGTAERLKFSGVVIFAVLWPLLSYYPIAHMVWWWAGATSAVGQTATDLANGAGQIWAWGAIDFAGGTVVHINAGIAALVGAIVLGKRSGYKTEPMPPHSLTFTFVGAGLLW
ncbi:MAG: ammonia channel protein, partial [Alphaproteobacteria bacterium]|nr:ammonia channel protein [Alphaproteobacteria bacterium]